MFVLKEKLKRIKESLKHWHKKHNQNIEGWILEAKEKLNQLELLGENLVLLDEELVIKREITSKIIELLRLNCNIQWQKAHSWWLKDGDAKTKYSHRCINRRRKDNEILCLNNRRLI